MQADGIGSPGVVADRQCAGHRGSPPGGKGNSDGAGLTGGEACRTIVGLVKAGADGDTGREWIAGDVLQGDRLGRTGRAVKVEHIRSQGDFTAVNQHFRGKGSQGEIARNLVLIQIQVSFVAQV